MKHAHWDYNRGREVEHRLLTYIEGKGHDVIKSTALEDRCYDIDAYINGQSYSIKTQHECLSTGNVVFEIQVQLRDDTWALGWYTTSEAEYYLFLVGTKLYRLDPVDVHEYVDEHGWPKNAYSKRSTALKQARLKHPHKQAYIGLFPLLLLRDLGIAKKIMTVPDNIAHPQEVLC